MIVLWISLFVGVSDAFSSSSAEHGVTPYLARLEDLPNVAAHGDAQHRGPRWYDYSSDEDSTDSGSTTSSEMSSETTSSSVSSSESTSASSFETKERKQATRKYRVCHPCPRDMMKRYKNLGIKWICGGYQRARRTFKSECMMRYRNCEDGTMFVKLYDHRCKNDTFHGRHWFYVYRV